jgi:hypothetical protein
MRVVEIVYSAVGVDRRRHADLISRRDHESARPVGKAVWSRPLAGPGMVRRGRIEAKSKMVFIMLISRHFMGENLHAPLKRLCVAICAPAAHLGRARKNNGE